VTTVGGDTLIEAVVAVARADKEVWPHFRRAASRVALRETEFTDYAAESFLRDWFCPSWTLRAIDGWAKQYILDVLSDALAGRCRLRGFIGLKEVEIPAGIFLSTRLVNELSANGESFWKNEIKLPDGDLVVGVTVSWGDRGISARPGPKEKREVGRVKQETKARGCLSGHAAPQGMDRQISHKRLIL
jgi:hypothetical protein